MTDDNKRSNVVELDDYRPHKIRIAKCSSCLKEWVAVCLAENHILEYPECGQMTGGFKEDDENTITIIFQGKVYKGKLMSPEYFEEFLKMGFKEEK